MIPNQVSNGEGLVAQETVFGWVLSGVCKADNVFGTNSQLLCFSNMFESLLHKF